MSEARVSTIVRDYATRTRELHADSSTAEDTYYPVIRQILTDVLRARKLPFDVRTGTKEARPEGAKGLDRPDLALYEADGTPAVFVEVKLPAADLVDMARSTDRNDQVGRYLASTGVVILSNVRGFGLLACKSGYSRADGKPVPPDGRELRASVELWPSVTAFATGQAVVPAVIESLMNLVEEAVTEFAPISDPASLARILARHARRAKADLPVKFTAVTDLLEDYQEGLGMRFEGREEDEFFRSSVVQTAFYAMFAGWTLWHRSKSGRPFSWTEIDRYLKIPFLGKLFYEFRHPDRMAELRLADHLDRGQATLERVDRDVFFARFMPPRGDLADVVDPRAVQAITYFYEPFLEAFDPDLRDRLGVWYTPPEIVRYQVAKVDRLLRDELGCPGGFADDRVVVLDPCCGTGAYLLEVLRCMATEIQRKGESVAAELVEAVRTRVIGFEVLMAPFVVAHLQIHVLLSELGITLADPDRPAVFLTNALTGWEEDDQVKLRFPEMRVERELATRVKREARIIVVLGNPPYNRFAAAMREEQRLVDPYKGIRRKQRKQKGGVAEWIQDGPSDLYTKWGIRKQLLNDLYIRFFRLAEKRIGEAAEYGVVSFISNSSYLTGRSHPLMRESLLGSFHEVWIDNLNGDKYKTGKVIPSGLPGAGTADQSIFSTDQNAGGIQVGTCVTTLMKRQEPKAAPGTTSVHYRDFWGRAAAKRRALVSSSTIDVWDEAKRAEAAARPEGPRAYETFTATMDNRWRLAPRTASAGGYESWPALDDLFPTSYQGVNPNRGLEGSLIDTDREALHARLSAYLGATSFDVARQACPELATPRARYEPERVWQNLRKGGAPTEKVLPYLVFPLDMRWVYYDSREKLLNEARADFQQGLPENEFLVAVPQPRRVSETRPLFARSLVDLHAHDRGSVCFPRSTTLLGAPQANLAAKAWQVFKPAFQLDGGLGDDGASRLVTDLFRVVLAALHAPGYQADHQSALAEGWAQVPIPKSQDLFRDLALAGRQVADLLDAQADPAPVIDAILGPDAATLAITARKSGATFRYEDCTVDVSYYGASAGRVLERPFAVSEPARAEWGDVTCDLFLNADVFLANVPSGVWGFELGGYPVLKKWLGYREAKRRGGLPLTRAEVKHLRSMVQRIAALLVVQPRLDELYEKAAADAFTSEELGLG